MTPPPPPPDEVQLSSGNEASPGMLKNCSQELPDHDGTSERIGLRPNATHSGSRCRRPLSSGCRSLPSSANASASSFPRTFK